jgi:hypothetical protein
MKARKDSLTAGKRQQVSCNRAGIFQQRKDSKMSLCLQGLTVWSKSSWQAHLRAYFSWWIFVSDHTLLMQ